MAYPARTPAPPEPEAPPLDPSAVERSYRLHRAKRRARVEQTRSRRRAHVRFWVVLACLFAATIVIGVTIWHDIQRLFGI